ncbi:hypothetical protein S83_013033, partial [Arachis hypogaea]
ELDQWNRRYGHKFGFGFITSTNKWLSQKILDEVKLLWVKENLQEPWSLVFGWMDLSDWLSYRVTGDDTRSLSTTVCKWTYLGHAHMKHINDKDSWDMAMLFGS